MAIQYPREAEYSEYYFDDVYEYRHCVLTLEMTRRAIAMKGTNKSRVLSESEWRDLGVQQSRGWKNFMVYEPEPHMLLFRRPKGTDPLTGKPPHVKLLTVQCSWVRDNQMSVACTTMSGEEAVRMNMQSTDFIARFFEKVADHLKLPSEQVHLILQDGTSLDPSSPHTLASIATKASAGGA